uniref:DNA polymerase epsilon subunit 3 n=1 Tax=Parastrongyloides trichosuri TaxID=131310 RepID=A0A0N4ZGI3_PARTI
MSEEYQEALPLAQIVRIMKRKAPKGAHFSKDFKSAMGRSAQIFIYYLTSTAQEYAAKDKRKKLMIQDLRKAVMALELDPLNVAVNEVINMMTSQVRVPVEFDKDESNEKVSEETDTAAANESSEVEAVPMES